MRIPWGVLITKGKIFACLVLKTVGTESGIYYRGYIAFRNQFIYYGQDGKVEKRG